MDNPTPEKLALYEKQKGLLDTFLEKAQYQKHNIIQVFRACKPNWALNRKATKQKNEIFKQKRTTFCSVFFKDTLQRNKPPTGFSICPTGSICCGATRYALRCKRDLFHIEFLRQQKFIDNNTC